MKKKYVVPKMEQLVIEDDIELLTTSSLEDEEVNEAWVRQMEDDQDE